MGKKQKGARRQILQLESKKPPQILSKQLKNLIHYSDSDEDSKKSNDSDSLASVPSKQVCPLDTQVADFFKEIDAMAITEECVEPKENSSPVKNDIENKYKDVSNQILKTETEVVEETSETESVAYCSWQEIQDESTGYSYYWNVETNEVTWDCPEEYANYVHMNSTHANVSLSQNKEKDELFLKKSQNKDPLFNKEDGSIIPISYFGESSSSDESSCNDKIVKKSCFKRKQAERIGNKSKVQMQTEISNELIGPQLPPNFKFPSNEDSDKISKTLNSSIKTVENETNSSLNQTVYNCMDAENFSKSSLSASNQSQVLDYSVTFETSSFQTKEDAFSEEKDKANVDKEQGKESPDSTVKQGIGLVEEYDSFTDEDEEASTINTCIKQKSLEDLSLSSGIQNQKSVKEIKTETLKEIESPKNMFAGVKRKNVDESDTGSNNKFIDKRSKRNEISSSLDIDNLFASHVHHQKHGFGFKMKEEFEAHETTNAFDSYVNRTQNRRNGFKSVNFVKSDQILDLNDVCGCTLLETSGPVKKEILEHTQSEEQFEKEDKVYSEELDLELKNVECTTSEVSHISNKDFLLESYSSEKTVSLTYEEDIDEIDKALCEALEAKKAAEKEPLISCSVFPTQGFKESIDCVIELSSDDNNLCPIKKVDPTEETDKTEILNLSSDLVDKLTFLVSNHSTLSSLSTLLVQLQTRLIDWQASALENIYFMARLQEVNHYMYQYEKSIVSGDWICQWDRENKRYFYTNSKSNHSQWTYPEDLKKDKTSWSSFQSFQHEVPASSASFISSDQDDLPTVSSSSPEMPSTKKISDSNKDENEPLNFPSPPPPPPGVDSPPPPPPHSPPPLPPDSTDQPEDMDLENSNDSCSHPIISNTALYEVNQIHYPSMLSCSTNHLLNNYGDNSVTSVSSTLKATNEDSNLLHRSQHTFPIVSNSCSINNTHVLWSSPQPSCSSDILKDSLENQISVITSVSSQHSDSVVHSFPSSSIEVSHNSSEDGVNKSNVSTANPPLKKEKKKTKLLSILALKKKNIPSLVEKWQKIREEQEKDNSDHS